jgi:hypothetical protein
MSDVLVFPHGEPVYFEGKLKEKAYKALLNRDLMRYCLLGIKFACIAISTINRSS